MIGKKILLVAALEILCLQLHAQKLHFEEKLDSVISIDAFKKEKFVPSYDVAGHISQVLRYRRKEDWQTYGKTLYFYDEEGRNTRLEEYGFNNSEWSKGYKIEVCYDSSGMLAEEILSLVEKKDWVPFTKDEYVYGVGGKCTETKHYLYRAGGWVVDSRWENTYDGNGFLVTSVHYQKEGECWEETYRNEHEYDDRGNETSDAFYVKSGDGWSGHYRFRRTYDKENRMTSETRYNWTQDGAWEEGSIVFVRRDSLGNESCRETHDARQNLLLAKEVLEYDTEKPSASIMGMDTKNLLHRQEWASPINTLYKYAYKLLGRQTVNTQGTVLEEWMLFYSK